MLFLVSGGGSALFESPLIPEDEIYMRANKNNPASLHVMLNNGGYIHHEDDGKVYVRIRK